MSMEMRKDSEPYYDPPLLRKQPQTSRRSNNTPPKTPAPPPSSTPTPQFVTALDTPLTSQRNCRTACSSVRDEMLFGSGYKTKMECFQHTKRQTQKSWRLGVKRAKAQREHILKWIQTIIRSILKAKFPSPKATVVLIIAIHTMNWYTLHPRSALNLISVPLIALFDRRTPASLS